MYSCSLTSIERAGIAAGWLDLLVCSENICSVVGFQDTQSEDHWTQ